MPLDYYYLGDVSLAIVLKVICTRISSADPKLGDEKLLGHDGQEVRRKPGDDVLPQHGRQSSVRLHEATADHERRQLSGRQQQKRAG